MADGQIVILDNSGDDNYNQSAREFLVSPIVTDLVRIILNDITLVAGGNYGEIFMSTDNGLNWSLVMAHIAGIDRINFLLIE